MKVTGDWIEDARAQQVCAMLTRAGHRALFVGGCVRNAVLDVSVGDIDISTDAPPDQVMGLAEAAGLRAVPTGIDHGTVTVVAGGLPCEITTFRRDVETDGRRAVVAFTKDIAEDALRRDLTMNALYALPDGTVVDPLGGLPDLLARRIRFIEDPMARIKEDYLRILRFFRFHAYYGDPDAGLDPDGLAACAALSSGLETLSNERIGTELLKLLSADDPSPSIAAFAQTGGLGRILPGADHRALPLLVHFEGAWSIAPEPLRRLAVLGGSDHQKLLRLSRKDAAQLSVLQDAGQSGTPPAELGYRIGGDAALSAVLLHAAWTEHAPPETAREAIDQGVAAVFPIAAADLQPRYQGAELGKKLKALEARWIASGFTEGRESLLSQ